MVSQAREVEEEMQMQNTFVCGFLINIKSQTLEYYLGPTLLGKTLMLGKIKGRKRMGCQRMRWLYGIIDSMDLSKPWEIVKNREAWCEAVHGATKS